MTIYHTKDTDSLYKGMREAFQANKELDASLAKKAKETQGSQQSQEQPKPAKKEEFPKETKEERHARIFGKVKT